MVPDARRPLAHEVYSIDRVTATSPDSEQVEYDPFYSLQAQSRTASGSVTRKRFWHARGGRPGVPATGGTEVFLSLVDLGFNPSAPADWTLDVETTCLNRDLPHRLTWARGASAFRLTQGGPIAAVNCLTGRATPTLRAAAKARRRCGG